MPRGTKRRRNTSTWGTLGYGGDSDDAPSGEYWTREAQGSRDPRKPLITEVNPMTTWSDVLRRAHLVSCSLHLECALPRATLPHAFELCRSSKRAMLLLLFLWLGASRASLRQPHLPVQLRLLQHFTVA